MFDNVELDLPVDDPLPLKLTDPRSATIKGATDFLWIRINDVPEVLNTRVYASDIDVVLEVEDPLGVAGGTFALKARGGVGKCVPHDGPADVKLGLADLATIYMGAHRPSQLIRAGRVNEVSPDLLHDLDAAFSTDRAPFCGTLF